MTLDVRYPRARTCEWCGGPIPTSSRSDSIYCSTGHRQAAWRAKVHSAQLAATAHPMRLAYADPPYVGKAGIYRDHPDYAGEVDHAELVQRLLAYDGWALSCSGASVPAIAALLVAAGAEPRLAIWHRRRMPNLHARVLSSWEGLFYVPARDVVVPRDSGRKPDPIPDILLGVDARPRPTNPRSVKGMKPPRFCEWMFQLLAAMPGDSLDDLYPGSGMVGRAFAGYTSTGPGHDA